MGQNRFFLKHWAPGFNPMSDDTSKFLVWIQLPELPLEFWDKEVFKLIATTFGQYVNADSVTKFKKHLIFVHFCGLMEKTKSSLLRLLFLPSMEFGCSQLFLKTLLLFILAVVKWVTLVLVAPRTRFGNLLGEKRIMLLKLVATTRLLKRLRAEGKSLLTVTRWTLLVWFEDGIVLLLGSRKEAESWLPHAL
ncbi:hypothetical protein SUGI_0556050 [Cryptomeria japonica]|nr:hypothetical protein SUGI_0556050 [Cryptomeria japonica]